ncbi:MAG: site-specific DNA-methyltransferase, partial [Bacteroidaceae bacterium]
MPTLNWIGKEKVVNHHLDVPFYTLEHQYGFHGDKPNDKSETRSGNLIIHGDNLMALKALLPEYEGRVHCAYFDPPYNTGEEKWVYNDNVNDPHIRKWLGEVVGKEGEDLSRHDKWLCMMYPRLVLVQKLLHPQGVAFISIDDNEYTNLKAICDEIFGKNCFVANISWQRTYSVRNDKDGIAIIVEHILVYSKEPNWIPIKLERTKDMDAGYANPDNDIAPWASVIPTAPSASSHQGMVYAIQQPFTGEFLYPTVGRCWSFGQEEMLRFMNGWCEYELRDLNDDAKRAEICSVPEESIRKGIKAIVLKNDLTTSQIAAQEVYNKGPWPKYFFTKGGLGGIRRKTYITEVEGKMPTNYWAFDEVGHTDEAKKELMEIFGGKSPFDTPKPTRLIERILDIATDDDSIVLDCFAGSGTTAHAVLMTNKKKHSNRRFILIELMDYA